MKLRNRSEVKKWLRMIPLAKKELNLKINFYNTLINDFSRVEVSDKEVASLCPQLNTYFSGLSDTQFYRTQIEECKKKFETVLSDWERLSKKLDTDEIMVITAKFLNGVRWDGMEFRVYFSRRQCFRIVDSGADKLIGETVGEYEVTQNE